jgi:hypothetical protein
MIIATWNSILIAFAKGEFYQAVVLLKTIAPLLGITVAAIPYHPGRYPLNANYTAYCERNMPSTGYEVDKWLKAHPRDAGEITVEDNNDEVEGEAEDD